MGNRKSRNDNWNNGNKKNKYRSRPKYYALGSTIAAPAARTPVGKSISVFNNTPIIPYVTSGIGFAPM